MAAMSNRFSMYSNTSSSPVPRTAAQHATQVSTTTLLNTLHNIYSSGQPYQLDAGTSLAVNTWLTAEQGGQGGTIDGDLTQRAWQHARRRAEDGCIVLCSLHESTPSLLTPYLASLPLSTPEIVYTALSAIRPFVTNVTPANHAASKYSALAASYTFTLGGNVTALTLALSTSGLNLSQGLMNIPSEAGYRAFDVFYYLLTSSSTPAEREFLGLQDPSAYSFLNKSGTFNPPSYLPTADDAASAEDFRACLKAIGIKGASQRGLLSALAGLLKLGNSLGFLVDAEEVEEICEDVGGLLGVDPDVLLKGCNSNDRESLIGGLYEAMVDWVISKANDAIAREIQSNHENGSSDGGPGGTPWADDQNGDTVSITIVDVPDPALGKALSLRGVFDDTIGINAEMKEDGIDVVGAGHSVIKEMSNAVADVEVDLGISGSAAYRDREYENDKRLGVLEKVGVEAESGGFLRDVLYPSPNEGINLKRGRFDLPTTLGCSRVWYHLSLHPTDESPATIATLPSITSSWSAGTVSRQLRAWRLPEWANRRNKHLDFTADFDVEEFFARYSRLGCKEGKDGAESWILERGWSNGDVVVGNERIWMREGAWWEAETMLDLIPEEQLTNPFNVMGTSPFQSGHSATPPNQNGSGFFPPLPDAMSIQDSRDNLLNRQSTATMTRSVLGGPQSVAPTAAFNNTSGGDYGLGAKGDDRRNDFSYYDHGPGHYTGEIDPETGEMKRVESKPVPFNRRLWVGFVWAMTFWIPSFVLRYVGRMKRPDVRLAWREKLVLTLLIFLLNAIIVFYIIFFGNLLCPNKDKVWNVRELSYHQGDDDFYVSVRGKVYDISDFWTIQHSDTNIEVDDEKMRPLAGLVLDAYFPPPLTESCPGFDLDDTIQLMNNNTDATSASPLAIHKSGPRSNPDPDTELNKITWYGDRFLPKMKHFYKGDLVHTRDNVTSMADENDRRWVIIDNEIYDLTDYFYTLDTMNNLDQYNFLPSAVTDLVKENPGKDITDKWQDTTEFQNSLNCLKTTFYVGKTDFRDSPKCQVNNYILLAFAVVICTIILIKFLAALQLGSKRRPSAQDKFVICQVPAYTEGEDQLRKGLDSLTALDYDNKRKLICVICDGMIVGGGNDRPTPKIVLDVLGVDPKTDPPALPFKSIGDGSEQLNYGKVYSGLYEYEGNVVPYIVVVKVGKESEQNKSKPGNRGKRDSQILLLNFLNRVHYRSAMSPLELEMFHQINNIIGVDPELYEYVFMVDADTSVKEDSLTRLVASCSNDAKIAGICGETSLQNEERSWWTMIQVYEYYISHHLVKAFESLFGSVTCLPGCFCMYRLRTADKGRPLIIADKVIKEYADIDVDTLHKKNLLSLGEDRYLTTLMTKHFPAMSYKFIPDAFASTAAPETWSVLLSQRRRWINSTVHNLAELVFLKDLCGFCCFSMRFVVFIDLFGTMILPATCVYLGYLIYTVSTGTGQIPYISIAMIAAVYGLQAIIFIIKRQWQHIGWMIIYLLAFPIYSFVLPIYSFWNQDNFTWGNTRIVIGEKGDKRIVKVDDEGFDPRNIPLQRWDDYALANSLPGRRGGQEKSYNGGYADDGGMEMDDIHSTYSSVKPASTILTGFPTQGQRGGPYMAPQSPAPFAGSSPGNRNSHFSTLSRYTDAPQLGGHSQRHMSTANMSSYQDNPMNMSRNSMFGGSENMLGVGAAQRQSTRSPLAGRPISGVVDFRAAPGAGPDDASIVEAIQSCLSEVDLDSVTKKQVRALVEQRLQTELTGERKTFLDRQIDHQLANMVYTASFAFFEALWEAGITYVFVNLGSDHPSILEAIVKGQNEKKDSFPTIVTVPNEMVALSMADGYARLTGKPQCVIVHVDVGTQGLGAAVHNASCGRAPVLVFAGLSPFTIEGEMRGSRTEYIHWIQDVPDQKQIVGQYCRYAGEIKSGKNVKQLVNRALQFAKSDPMGPVYLLGAREAMEEELEPYKLNQDDWHQVSPAALSPDAIEQVASHLVAAKEPLVITGYAGRWARTVAELVTLADNVKGLRVLDTGGSDMCFPADHPASLGLRFGKHEAISTADFILVIDCDVPWIPTQCKPSPSAKIIHIDVDPLKQQMPVFYIPTVATYRADAGVSLKQINQYIASNSEIKQTLSGPEFSTRQKKLEESHKQRIQSLADLADTPEGGNNASFNVNYLVSQTRKACPADTIWAIESVTLTLSVSDQIQATLPNSWINCGGGGLGWSGGGALGIKLASDQMHGGKGKGKFVCQIVGDGTYLFSVPGSVYWVSRRYNIPVLTIVLNNKGWNAPRNSMLLVHPDGDASRATNEDLNISFVPTPDYAGIAKAAAGGQLWAGRAGTVEELAKLLPEAIASVQNGVGAVLEAQLDGTEGKYTGK